MKTGTYIYTDLFHKPTLKLDHKWRVEVFGGVQEGARPWLTTVKCLTDDNNLLPNPQRLAFVHSPPYTVGSTLRYHP